jgi:2-polyprenyl-6-methoxyphenol hydroxylase-like FAD-dependent oxidoreductase
LEDFARLTCLPQAASIAAATPIGPCATLSAEDTWVDVPYADGVVLIGDAAGYNNPIIGEGTSIAMRDARMVADLLLGDGDWSTARFAPYADERRERMRRLRFTASLDAALYTTFGPAGAARRGRFFGRMQDPNFRGGILFAAQTAAPENAPDWAFTDEFRAEVLQ